MSKLKLNKTFELFLRMGEIVLEIDMSEYHMGIVKKRHLNDIRDYILRQGSNKLFVSDKLSKANQLQLFCRNYRQLKRIYKYLPSKKENLLFVTFRHNIAIYLKHILNIPEDVQFNKGMRRKFGVGG